MSDPFTKNPHAPYRDAWERQFHENMNNGGAIDDPIREEADRLSALTWSDEDKKPRRDDP